MSINDVYGETTISILQRKWLLAMHLPSIAVFPVRLSWRYRLTCSSVHPRSDLIQAMSEAG